MVRHFSSHFRLWLIDHVSDILGISDREVWQYGQALRKMARDCKLDHIHFLRLRNLIGEQDTSEPIDEVEYLKDAPVFRSQMIEKYLPKGFNPEAHIAKDADATSTYRGYIKFLETDLANSVTEGEPKTKAQIKKHHEEVAKKMIVRGKVKCPPEFSIHPLLTFAPGLCELNCRQSFGPRQALNSCIHRDE